MRHSNRAATGFDGVAAGQFVQSRKLMVLRQSPALGASLAFAIRDAGDLHERAEAAGSIALFELTPVCPAGLHIWKLPAVTFSAGHSLLHYVAR